MKLPNLEEVQERQMTRLNQSWFFQMRPERKHRLKYVVKLSAELERIKAIDVFGTAFGAAVIEFLIEGDYDQMLVYDREMLVYEPMPSTSRTAYDQLWATFKATLQEAVALRPANPQAGDTIQ